MRGFCRFMVFLAFFGMPGIYSSAFASERKDYADYRDWQLGEVKSTFVKEWEKTDSEYGQISDSEYLKKVDFFRNWVNEESGAVKTLEFENSWNGVLNQLNAAFDELEKAVENGGHEQVLEARINANWAVINYLNLQTNILENSSSTMFKLLAGILVVLFIFIGITAFFALRLKKSRQNEQDTSDFNKKILKVQEKERKRLSLELHDTIAQDLRAVQMLTSKVFSLGKMDSDGDEESLRKKIIDLESKLILDVRTMCYNLTPPDLDRKDLKAAISHYCTTFKRDTGIECTLVIADGCEFSEFSQESQLDIFRIMQEALTNVAKHSKAEEATVILRKKDAGGDRMLVMLITDSGCGFAFENAKKLDSHFGLRGMKERAKSLGGTIRINTVPDEGTEVYVEVPVR